MSIRVEHSIRLEVEFRFSIEDITEQVIQRVLKWDKEIGDERTEPMTEMDRECQQELLDIMLKSLETVTAIANHKLVHYLENNLSWDVKQHLLTGNDSDRELPSLGVLANRHVGSLSAPTRRYFKDGRYERVPYELQELIDEAIQLELQKLNVTVREPSQVP
jgi:hypothetical protein